MVTGSTGSRPEWREQGTDPSARILRRYSPIFALAVLSVIGGGFATAQTVDVSCPTERITIPLFTSGSGPVAAASFVFGEYAQDQVNSTALLPQLEALAETERWTYPEYAVMKIFQYSGEGNRDAGFACFEEGFSRNEAIEGSLTSMEEVQRFYANFSQIVFVSKSQFGPYIRIDYYMQEAGGAGRRFPWTRYLKTGANGYRLTQEIDDTHLFHLVASKHIADRLQRNQAPATAPDVTGMNWAVIDDDPASPVESKAIRRVQSTRVNPIAPVVPRSYSPDYLVFYHNFRQENTIITAGEQTAGLRPELRFFEQALTAYWTGTEEEILATWSGMGLEMAQDNIRLLKGSGAWPNQRRSPFGAQVIVIATAESESGSVIYYRMGETGPLMSIALRGKVTGQPYSLDYELDEDTASAVLQARSVVEMASEQYEGAL